MSKRRSLGSSGLGTILPGPTWGSTIEFSHQVTSGVVDQKKKKKKKEFCGLYAHYPLNLNNPKTKTKAQTPLKWPYWLA
jgi:hypothetical protein